MLDNFYIRYIYNFFFVLIHPMCWIQNYSTSLEYDKWLWEQLKNPDIALVDEYYTKVNNTTLWSKNFPYAFATVVGMQPFMPLSVTRYKLKKMIEKQYIKQLTA